MGFIIYKPTSNWGHHPIWPSTVSCYVDGFIGPTNSDFDGFMARKKVFWMDLFNDNQLVIGVISFHLQVFIGPQLQVCKKT